MNYFNPLFAIAARIAVIVLFFSNLFGKILTLKKYVEDDRTKFALDRALAQLKCN